MFAASADEANGARVALQVANEGAGYAFLGHALGFFFFVPDLNNRSAKIPDACFAGHLGFLSGSTYSTFTLGERFAYWSSRSCLRETGGLIEIGDRGVLLQALHDLRGLVGEAVTLVGSRVVRLVVTVGQNVGDYDHGDHHQDVDGRVCRVFGLSGFHHWLAIYDLQRSDSMERAVKNSPRKISGR